MARLAGEAAEQLPRQGARGAREPVLSTFRLPERFPRLARFEEVGDVAVYLGGLLDKDQVAGVVEDAQGGVGEGVREGGGVGDGPWITSVGA